MYSLLRNTANINSGNMLFRMHASIFFMVVLFLFPSSAISQKKKALTTIAFGSCDHQDNPVKLWDDVIAQQPGLWIWGGDIVYGDTYDMDSLRNKYNRQKANSVYQKLLSRASVTGTYDDHDYGVNDGGRDYTMKKESRDILFDFLGIAADDPARKREGAYHSRTYGPRGRQVKVINLDTRYFRDSLTQETFIDPQTGRTERRNLPTAGLDILGEAQWKWLETELRRSRADIHIINSSIQVISSEHRFEKWANFPDARQRLFKLIAASGAKRVFFISGDRHIAELSSIRSEGMAYPLYDLTSSGLTHTWSVVRQEENRYRVGELVVKRNFGIIRIDWQKAGPLMTYDIRGECNEKYATFEIKL
jgi:alkaline phosphatase D